MIPRRITLEGFLCYKEARTIDLRDADLWVFTGRNGSGKSAVFDAITFALFEWHRGSDRRDSKLDDLINQESDGLRVEFEFELAGKSFRIQRSLRRGQGSERQICEHVPSNGRAPEWPPIPETHRESGFADWVTKELGMSARAFTASVLLRQGESDRLVSARPKERFEILSDVVDLDRYKRLAKAADDRRKAAQNEAQSLSGQLRDREGISAEAVEDARHLAEVAEEARLAADRERESLLGIERRARDWSALIKRREEEHGRLARAEALLSQAEFIERDAARLKELKAVLATLLEEWERAGAIVEAEEATARLDAERAANAEKLSRIDDLIAQAAEHRRTVAEEAELANFRRSEVEAGRARLALPMDRAARAAEADREIADLEARIAARPPGLAEEVRAAEALRQRAAIARQSLPRLESLAECRNALARALDDGRSAETDVARLEGEHGRLVGERARRIDLVADARAVETAAHGRVAHENTLRDALQRRLEALDVLGGKPECVQCGQPLTPSHLDGERKRIGGLIGDAEARLGDARWGLSRAEAERRVAEASAASVDEAIQAVDRSLADARSRAARADEAAEGHRIHCRRVYVALADAERSMVSPHEPIDWTATEFPSPGDIEAYRRDSARFEALDEATVVSREALHEDRSDREGLEGARRRRRAIGLAPGDERAADEDGRLAKELEALRAGDSERAGCLARAEENLRGLAARRECLDRTLIRIDRELAAARTKAEVLGQARRKARASLSEAWRAEFDSLDASRVAALQDEESALERDGIEARSASIPAARRDRDAASAAIRETESLLDAIPNEARRDPRGIEAEVAEAKGKLDEFARAATTSRAEAERLASAFEEYQVLSARSRQAASCAAVAEKLAKLLGWDGLQRQLLTRAERDIVANANPILHRISGGDLQLRLCSAGDADRALDLEVIDQTHGRTRIIKSAYLSGSQRFRVAVSLALAIGRTMKHGRDRPIDSVVIDEGFGSLDAQGRREMVAQMRDLRGFLSRIVLVSHQEDFAGAFEDGYRFDIVDGSTVVERIGN